MMPPFFLEQSAVNTTCTDHDTQYTYPLFSDLQISTIILIYELFGFANYL